MAVKAYALIDGQVVPIGGSEVASGGIVSVNTRASESRDAVIAAGTAFDVPAYEIGTNQLQVWVNGLLCVKGNQYTEVSTSTIAFTFDLPADASVVATVTTSAGSTSFTTQVQTSSSREATMPAGTVFTVPAYTVGSDMCRIYLDGLTAIQDVTWQEVSATSIKFLVDIPADMEITVVCSVVS